MASAVIGCSGGTPGSWVGRSWTSFGIVLVCSPRLLTDADSGTASLLLPAVEALQSLHLWLVPVDHRFSSASYLINLSIGFILFLGK